jgi:hypothetical protein
MCQVGAQLIPTDNRQLDEGTNNFIPFQLKRVLLWQFNVPGNSKTYLDLWSAWCFCLPLTKFEFLLQTFIEVPNCQMSWKSINWELHWYMWQMDRHDKGKALHVTMWIGLRMTGYLISDHSETFRCTSTAVQTTIGISDLFLMIHFHSECLQLFALLLKYTGTI